MNKVKEFYGRHKLIIKYLLFGLITMLVSFSAFYATLWVGKTVFGSLEHGKDSVKYLATNVVANIIKWLTGVLTAFYTNKKWVFTDADQNVSTKKQLFLFAEGRVLTLLMAMILQYVLELLFAQVITNDMTVLGMTFSAEIIGTTVALLIYSVVEIIANYHFSKRIVFKKKQC